MNNDATAAQLQMQGAGQATTELKAQPQLQHLLGILNNTIDRYQIAINMYRNMNDGITGCGPESCENDVKQPTANGLIYETIERAEKLHDMCMLLDDENNRLNSVIAIN